MTDEVTTTQDNDLMTPEELALLKKLQAKRKAQQAKMGETKETFFTTLTEKFAAIMGKCRKDVITVGMDSKKPFSDGNIYAVTFGIDDEKPEGQEEIDTHSLAERIVSENIETIEPLMGISNSLKVSGTYEGKKLFWQIRKRPA